MIRPVPSSRNATFPHRRTTRSFRPNSLPGKVEQMAISENLFRRAAFSPSKVWLISYRSWKVKPQKMVQVVMIFMAIATEPSVHFSFALGLAERE